MLLQMILLQGW